MVDRVLKALSRVMGVQRMWKGQSTLYANMHAIAARSIDHAVCVHASGAA
jgi:hypothetical protein